MILWFVSTATIGTQLAVAGKETDWTGTQWHAFYVGQTQNFYKRLPTHEDWPRAALLGASQGLKRIPTHGTLWRNCLFRNSSECSVEIDIYITIDSLAQHVILSSLLYNSH